MFHFCVLPENLVPLKIGIVFTAVYGKKCSVPLNILSSILCASLIIIGIKERKGTMYFYTRTEFIINKKVQVGKDQEKAQSEKDSHSKNRGGKKLN